jgi:tetratricopeptide (TPR) repeat protein
MVDYTKWEGYECDENDEDLRLDLERSIQRINHQKEAADQLYHTADEESDRSLFSKSLELYLSVTNEILSHPHLTHLWIPCQLNCASCYLKLQKWSHCIQVCDSLFEAQSSSLLSTNQQIRCHFLRAKAYFESSKNETSLRSALGSISQLRNLVNLSQASITEEEQSDYDRLYYKLTAYLQYQGEGWKLISQGQHMQALRWFNDAILSNPNSAKDIDLLSSYYEGVGAAYEAMKEFSKVCHFLVLVDPSPRLPLCLCLPL